MSIRPIFSSSSSTEVYCAPATTNTELDKVSTAIDDALAHFEERANQRQNYDDQPHLIIRYEGKKSTFPSMHYVHIDDFNKAQENCAETKKAFFHLIERVNQGTATPEILRKILSLIVANKLFDVSNNKEALILMSSLINDHGTLKLVAEQIFFPLTPLSLQTQRQDALWCAVYFNDTPLAKVALSLGADVNTPLYHNITPLLLACSKGFETCALFLIEQNASVKCIGGTHDHKTPYSEALMRNDFSPEFLKKLEELDGGFSEKFHLNKRIAHLFSVVTAEDKSEIQGKRFILSGYRPRYILEEYLKASRPFYASFEERLLEYPEEVFGNIHSQLSPETLEKLKNKEIRVMLCEAIDQTLETMEDSLKQEIEQLKCTHYSPERKQSVIDHLLARLDNGKPVMTYNITKTDWDSKELHAWGFVSFKDENGNFTVKKCDRRNGEQPGIFTKVYTRDEYIQLMQEYHHAYQWKTDFRGRRGSEMSKSVINHFNKENPFYVQQTEQKIGNCCYHTTQSLELATLIGTFENILGPGQDVERIAKFIKQTRTNEYRYTTIKEWMHELQPSSACSSSSAEVINPLLKQIYFNSIHSRNLANITELFSDYRHLYDSTIQNEALKVVWGKLKNHFPKIPTRDPSATEIREMIKSNPEIVQTITKIDLSNIDLKVLPSDIIFFTHVETLILKNCSLKVIPALHFPMLKKLDLSNNQLVKVPDFHAPLLEELTVTNNKLISAPKIDDLNHLLKLDLSNNAIVESPENFPPTLEHLLLSNNQIRCVDLSSLPQLKNLRLSSNPIGSIPLLNSPQLSDLYLDNTALEEISEEEETRLNQLTSLRWLNLSHNRLTKEPTLSLPNLESVVLHNNLYT